MKKKARTAKASCGILLGFFALIFYAHLGTHILEFRRAGPLAAVSGALHIGKPAASAKPDPCAYCQTARIPPLPAGLGESLPGVSSKAGLARRDGAIFRLPDFSQSFPRPPPLLG